MLKELLNWGGKRDLVELIVPRRSFSDVILPENTRQSLYEALMQIEKHHLIFQDWGLGERHNTGTGLVFNFAGPPGTGKTICAEAVARALGKKLLKVRYSEMESCWAGESGKNVVAVFRDARQQDTVLFFDEADSIASRRFAGTAFGYERESNQTVNILLNERSSGGSARTSCSRCRGWRSGRRSGRCRSIRRRRRWPWMWISMPCQRSTTSPVATSRTRC